MKAQQKRNLENTRRIAAVQRELGKAHERKNVPYEGTKKLIAKFKNKETITNIEILHELAITKLHHKTVGGKGAVVPVEFIDIIAEKLAPDAVWAREQAEAKKARAAEQKRKLQAAADSVWSAHPRHSKSRVAQIIARQFDGNADWIRRNISKPK
jgi:hypothetical protein